MPVARIISSSFEDALQFADYLRPLFDTVEIAQPGRASDTAVDLEVNLELCTPQEAWRQIAELSREPNGEIFVAPGALFSEAEQPGALAVVTPELETGTAKEAGQVLESVSEEVEAAIEQAGAAVVKAAGSNGSGTHKAPSGAAAGEEEVNWLGRARESLRQWLAVRALLREIRQMQQQEREQEQQRQRQMALQFERERRDREVRELAVARVTEQEAAAIPETEQPALEPEAILQRQATEEEERRKAEQEEAIRRGRFVAEILRRRAQEQSLDADTAPVEFETVPAESFAAEVETAPIVRFGGGRRSDRLRPAMALAGVTSVLLMAALVGYAHRRPASPVPASVLERSSAVEQKVPFGPAVMPAAAPEPAPVVQTPMEAVLESPPAPEKRGFQRDFRRVRVDRHEVDYVADDVTVRHFNYGSPRTSLTHPATAVPVRVSSGGVKQISDMD
ncbi:MAG: hypothetical protein ACM3PW_14555 [Chlamydiota bacterium]